MTNLLYYETEVHVCKISLVEQSILNMSLV